MPRIVCQPIFDIGPTPQSAIAGWPGIFSIDARAVAGAAEEVFGRKASVSRKKGARKGRNAAARNGRCMASGYLDIYPNMHIIIILSVKNKLEKNIPVTNDENTINVIVNYNNKND